MVKIESICIVKGEKLSDIDRAKNRIQKEDFVEIRVIRDSPRDLKIIPIKKGIKPTANFRKAIEDAGILDFKF